MSYDLKIEDIYGFARAQGIDTKEKGDELHLRLCPYCRGGSKPDEWTFAINLRSGAYKCLRASCDHQGHFVELCRDFDYPLQFDVPKANDYVPLQIPGSGTHTGTNTGTGAGGKKPSSTRKYVCPCCGLSVRATKSVNVGCLDCDEPLVLAA